ncbi:MAG: hypothetical protein PHE21_02965 [Candidatus Dojkabacteria bacterium]|nr:hypothetical protein [Candidatus Dojkabacteria bacterium]
MEDLVSVQVFLEILSRYYEVSLLKGSFPFLFEVNRFPDEVSLLKGSFPFLFEVNRFPDEVFEIIKNKIKERGITGNLIVRFEIHTSELLKGSIKTQLDDFTNKEFLLLREDIEHAILVLL